MHKNMLRRAAVLPALMAVLLLAGLVGPATAHFGDLHATSVAEGGSTLFIYNPPGIDPTQEFWLDGLAAIKHRVGTDGKDYYRASFKVNSWRGVYSEDDTIYAAPGDAQAVNYVIRAGLYLRDTNTGALTPLAVQGWFTNGNGWSYGCQGDGSEVQVNPSATTQVVTRLFVRGDRKFYYNGHWYSSGQNSGYHLTSSYRMGTVHVQGAHGLETDPLSGYFIGASNLPASAHAGYCPLWTVVS